MPLTTALIRTVIEKTTEPQKFERFACDSVAAAEGDAAVLPTSRSWDLGRDARGVGTGDGIYCCASLTAQVEAKAAADIERLLQAVPQPRKIYFCSSQALSEQRVEQLKQELRVAVPPGTDVEVLGVDQLGALAERNPAPFDRNFAAEQEELRQALLAPLDAGDDLQANSLALAQFIVGHDETPAIRREAYLAAIRSTLSDGAPRNLRECCNALSAKFRLARSLSELVVRPYVEALLESCEVAEVDGRMTLTEAGMAAIATSCVDGAADLLDGRNAFRAYIETGIGTDLDDTHFDRAWSVFRAGVSSAFFSHGRAMVEWISALIGTDGVGAQARADQSDHVAVIARNVGATSMLPAQQEELEQAVRDIFRERSGPIFEWLVRLCCAYVALCSLGIEGESRRAIERVVRKMTLALDTDVILNLLCEGEADHQAAKEVVRRLQQMGARVVVCESAVEEVAYHASIADVDFREVERLIPGSAADRQQLIENAFVRTFAQMMAVGRARLENWPAFIRQYAGTSAHDGSSIRGILRGEFGIDVLARSGPQEDQLRRRADEIAQRLASETRGFVPPGSREARIRQDKAARDARLYVDLVAQSNALRREDPEKCCLLISSGGVVKRIDRELRALGEYESTLPLRALVYLLGLVPEVSLGMSAMEALLFDAPGMRFKDGFERKLLRIVRELPNSEMPWARRSSLVRHTRERLIRVARESGDIGSREGQVDLERELTRSDRRAETAAVIRESLSVAGADSALERENRELRASVEALRREVEGLRRRTAR